MASSRFGDALRFWFGKWPRVAFKRAMSRTKRYSLIGPGAVASVVIGCTLFYIYRSDKQFAFEEMLVFAAFNIGPFLVMLGLFWFYEWFVAPSDFLRTEQWKTRLAAKLAKLQDLKTEALILVDRFANDDEANEAAWAAYQDWQRRIDAEFETGVHDSVRRRYFELIIAGHEPIYNESIDVFQSFPVARNGPRTKTEASNYLRRRLIALGEIVDKLIVRLHEKDYD